MWTLPTITTGGPEKYDCTDQREQLQKVLTAYNVKGQVIGNVHGPVVTRYDFEMAEGGKVARIERLCVDIGRSMCTSPARVSPIAGKSAVGIEIPNQHRKVIRFLPFEAGDAALPLYLGKDISGSDKVVDLSDFPHLLVAGTTGSGKSVFLHSLVCSLLLHRTPDQLRFLMIDPKMIELRSYEDIPHLLGPIITDPMKAIGALAWAAQEMETRYTRMVLAKVRNIEAYNINRQRGKLPYIVIVIDEYADLLSICGREFEQAVQRLAQKARAAGIHIVLATQRPSVDVVTGIIKANFPARICFKVVSKFDSGTVLSEQGAENLLGKGDMLFQSPTEPVVRVHGPFINDHQINNLVSQWQAQGKPKYEVCEVKPADPAETEPKRSEKDYKFAFTLLLTAVFCGFMALHDEEPAWFGVWFMATAISWLFKWSRKHA